MRVEVAKSTGADADCVRLTGRIASAQGERAVWFDVPAVYEEILSRSGAPWLLVMLPVAATSGEPIDLDLPLDPFFLENIRGLAATWASWYPGMHEVSIRAPVERAEPAGTRAAQFFSGGVDSWFTLLRHAESTERFPQIGDVDDLITIWGFDIPIGRRDEFRRLAESAREVAQHYGKRHVVVATNLRENMEGAWKEAWGPRWGELSHGAGLAAAGLVLERAYARVKIASTHRFSEHFAYGSHPLTDALFSTSATSFLHDHALYSRTDKIERIAESDYALSRLKVCYEEGAFRNCSQCVKCHRMLLCFDILGILDRAASFDVDVYRENRSRHILVTTENDLARVAEVKELALRHGRREIASIIDQSIDRSRRVNALTQGLKRVSWRAWSATYRRLAGDMIGA